MSRPDPKPCPDCGSTKIDAHSREDGDTAYVWSQCSGCGRKGPEVRLDNPDDAYSLVKWDKAEAAWNGGIKS